MRPSQRLKGRTLRLSLHGVWIALAAGCSLTNDLDDVLCPKDDPECERASPASGGGAEGDGDGSTGGRSDGTGASGGEGGGGSDPNCPAFGDVVVEYQNANPVDVDNRIRPYFRLFNQTSENVAFESLEIRYYFTEDAGATAYYECSFAFGVNATGGCDELVTGQVLPTTGTDTNSVLSLTFSDSVAPLLANKLSSDIQGYVRLTTSDDFDQTNDYSYGNETAHVEPNWASWDKVTLHCGDTLVWGTPPE